MPNRSYEAGRRWEYAVRNKYEDAGWTVMRTAGSKGPFDLIAVGHCVPTLLIQCKRTGSTAKAKSLIKDFEKNPPLIPSNKYNQVLEVHVKGGERWQTTV